MYTPVVDKDVRNTQTSYQETGGPLCLETNSDHNTGAETDEGDDKTEDAELTLEDESNEQEYEKDSPCQLETEGNIVNVRTYRAIPRNLLLPPVVLANVGQTGEQLLVLLKRVREDH
jgi:hypothetical protein